MLHRLKKLVPPSWLQAYHYSLARLAAFRYGYPSRKLIVIGVTGTNGKTTVSYLTAKALEASGFQTGCTSTAVIKIGKQEALNDLKMTMPGRFYIQKQLRAMLDAGCRYVVVETSSQGLIQHRHVGIEYDIAVFTNLTPEHIEAHGGFENYQRAKRVLFEYLATRKPKTLFGKPIPKVAVINADSEYGDYYAQTPGLQKVHWFSTTTNKGLVATNIQLNGEGSDFEVEHQHVHTQLPGAYNVSNALAALAVCKALDVPLPEAAGLIANVDVVPGRFQFVRAGQPWKVVVDYAPEPESLKQIYRALKLVPHARLIHVLGSCGGGRDIARRPVLGQMAGETADIVIVTNEDPYDDNPTEIMTHVAEGAVGAGKQEGESLFLIEDRAQAIKKAMQLAQTNDLVLLTGKGAETWICGPNGQKTPWNEAQVAHDAIQQVLAA